MMMRKVLRYGHLSIATLIAVYIYSPTLNDNATYEAWIKFGVVPLVVISGLAMWQQGRIKRWLRRG
ncbi:hypothetical protein [Denitrobaculum tricleocarpae]|uniref:Uncharacterized protein n=1 Tax=Denitrobaculum tricleocarpae TaxID=2591009 RepID=A0A545SSW1_9PROT|nr:hypothetical protein [Denitrobaculum tricleocarpae]TQV68036.1 hypothetical protein FKG95_29385 [Denitrobaculum tricleocarpae]